jgi:hypothetical protein
MKNPLKDRITQLISAAQQAATKEISGQKPETSGRPEACCEAVKEN